MQTSTKLLTWGLLLQQAVDLHSLNPEALFNLAVHPVLVSSVFLHLLKGIFSTNITFK